MPQKEKAQQLYPIDVFHYTRPPLAIIGANTGVIWAKTFPAEPIAARSDGWWGPHEYVILPQTYDRSSPYMAWIPSQKAYEDSNFFKYTGLDPSLALLSFDEFPLVPVPKFSTTPAELGHIPHTIANLPPKPQVVTPNKAHLSFFNTSDDMRAIVKEQVFALISEVRRVIDNLHQNPDFHFIRMPEEALFRLKQAYYWNLLPDTVTNIGHTLILAGLKRAVYELHGFLLWRKDDAIRVEPLPHQGYFAKLYGTRGVIVDNYRDYNAVGRFGVAVYMEANLDDITLQPTVNEVELSPIPIHRQLLEPLGSRSGHHTYIYFYPPIAEHFAFYELAARGYVSRLDVYEPNRDVDRVHDKMVQDKRKLWSLSKSRGYS
jgi:hypothetical protein